MNEIIANSHLRYQRTRLAVIGTSILNEPLWTLYSLFSFILHKDLHSTAFQIAVLTMLRPLVSLFAMYWSSVIIKRPEKLLSNVLWAGLLSRLPFLFFPLINNSWILICCIVFYLMLSRGGMPAWIEILKLNLPTQRRSSIFSVGSAVGYIEGIVLAIGVGYLLDHQAGAWRWMFPISAGFGMAGVLLQARVPLEIIPAKMTLPSSSQSLKAFLIDPWKHSVQLLRKRRDFGCYQWGFMLCGLGIMVIQPALPLYFVDTLGLSYIDLAIALSICKGLGFAATSPIWGRWLSRENIFPLSGLVDFFMGLFPLFLLFAFFNPAWVYVAYVAYGIAQAGSHLSWHLSGTLFAKDEDSSLFTSVNVMMVGLRGGVIPPLGSLLCVAMGTLPVLTIGAFFCFYGAYKMVGYGKTVQLKQ